MFDMYFQNGKSKETHVNYRLKKLQAQQRDSSGSVTSLGAVSRERHFSFPLSAQFAVGPWAPLGFRVALRVQVVAS